ncbi:inositol monophosphatase family protein [Sphingomonas sp. LY29]|uniref:inositol monophosphatase family protein n=1 Tax=Sphingomonas sp. LY29 TaxID=3095341 RepID=UPI002D782497|nr:inositol monophosphatase family protein [Sphingomonas sp. LY29]WRP25306.1 inositol monophosphatase family protein [Sphingomonas sp. LY29]
MTSLSHSSATLHQAVQAVMTEAADRAIMPRYRRLAVGDVAQKAVDDPVTIADRESEEILSEGLSKIIADALVVGEEDASVDPSIIHRLGEKLCWIIDPLDGTGNFVSGDGPFGIMVALAERGEVIGGWILDPRSKRFVAAAKGAGTWIDERRVRVQEQPQGERTAGLSALVPDDRRRTLREGLSPSFNVIDMARCAAEEYPRLLLGRNSLAFFQRTLAWDHAAGVLCLTEAGGDARRFDGSAYRVDDERHGLLAASTPALWDEGARLASLG